MQFDRNHNIVLGEGQPYFKHIEMLRIYDPSNGGPHYGLYTPRYYPSCYMKQERFVNDGIKYYPHTRVYR